MRSEHDMPLSYLIAFCFLVYLSMTNSPMDINNKINYFKHITKRKLNEVYFFVMNLNSSTPTSSKPDVSKKEEEIVVKLEENFETKYLEKFKKFPNEFSFNENDKLVEEEEYKLLKESCERLKFEIKDQQFEVDKYVNMFNVINETVNVNELINKNNKHSENYEDNCTNLSNHAVELLLSHYDLKEEYEEDPDDIDFKGLIINLLIEKEKHEKHLKTLIDKSNVTDEQLREEAHKNMINKKLDGFIDNYVMDYTPLGNIYMRYNNNKKTFEYFSNNSMPYRYLEPVCRKYVMTFWCKPIFVDIDEELKKAEIKYDEEQKSGVVKKPIIKSTIDLKSRPMKNRNTTDAPVLVNKTINVGEKRDKILVKENANRYTWEGRLTNFCPLKKIDKKVTNKKLAMTYADFKNMNKMK